MADRCLFCDQPATLYCDYPLAMVQGDVAVVKGVKYPITTMAAMMATPYTCDAPFCAAHGKQVGHICGGDDGCESIDYCQGDHGEKICNPLWPSEIAQLRTNLHTSWRRTKIRNDNKEQTP
jgi:hypothetical protein